MVALPEVGDIGWGDDLNTWLLVGHNADGTTIGGSGDNELDYTIFTSDVNITATSEPSANLIVEAAELNFDGLTEIWIEFSCQMLRTAAGVDNQIVIADIFEDGVAIGRIGQVRAGTVGAAESVGAPVGNRRRWTPTAGDHIYSINGWVTLAGTAVAQAGLGGTTASVPGYIRIEQI